MSQDERDVLKVMSAVAAGKSANAEAVRPPGVCVRPVRRIRRRLEEQGDAGVVHRLRGRPSNRRADPELRTKALGPAAGTRPVSGRRRRPRSSRSAASKSAPRR